jgi:gamma-glutamylcyclotransferase (GGCT)/AIG2-like uncharacterized protein YtfP
MNHHDPPKENTKGLLRLAVYGTLRKGYLNHERFCRGVLSIEPITIIGRLYQFSSGIPILEVPKEHILAHGTSDPLADVATQERFTEKLAQHPELLPEDPPKGDWGHVSGELLTFDDPEIRLPAIDRLEGFQPDRFGPYQRVLTQVLTPRCDHSILTWIYVLENRNDCNFNLQRIPSWPTRPA